MNKEKQESKFKNLSLHIAIWVSATLLTVSFFQWNLVDIFTVFIFPLLQGALYLVFICCFLISIVSTFKNRKKLNFKKVLPVYVYVVTILVAVLFPMTNIWLNLNFYMHYSEREKVALLVEQGVLKPNVPWNNTTLHLPPKYQRISLGGGDIIVEKSSSSTEILFFTFRGFLNSYSGFLYTSSTSAPSEFLGDKLVNSIKYKEHWYFVASAN